MITSSPDIPGQLTEEERSILTTAILEAPKKPETVIEVGTWLGGGSTLHILRALHRSEIGHLWGIEADRSIYEKMTANIAASVPDARHRFTPLFGFSEDVLPEWLATHPNQDVHLAFLDGGNNPGEQIKEFELLDPRIPIGGQILAHDAKMRKGKWLVPYLSRLDHWNVELHLESEFGLLHARKVALRPSAASRRRAERCLLKLRCNPIEVAAAVLPSQVCAFALRLIPDRLAWRLSDGRK